jgi:gamma-glutamyltranspeptidase/glutathione hydrolase
LVSVIVAFCTACADTKLQYTAQQQAQYVESNNGIVASADPLATAAGLRILQLGGNAVDAAVATGFALSVVEPSMSGLGGRAVILLRLPDGSFHGVDGMSEVPAAYPGTDSEGVEYGYRTIGIPGAVAAYAAALEDFGTLPLDIVMQPAIELAEKGFTLPFSTVDRNLDEFPGSRQTFRRLDGTPYLAGELFRPDALARTLRLIAENGPEAFYRGEIAHAMARDMSANGGYVTVADLANYEARPLRIEKGEYRGFELIGTGSPPSGYMLIEALHILEHFDLDKAKEVVWATRLCQALQLALNDRDSLPGPPADREALMVSKSWAARRALLIQEGKGAGSGESAGVADDEPIHTSHLSVVDRDGMVVAMTQSLGPAFGSAVVTPGLGFLYAVTMGSYKDGLPGTRPNLSQSPFIVQWDEQPVLVLGAAGGGRIPSAILSVVSRLIDRSNSFSEAMRNPRVHTGETCPRLETTGEYSFEATVTDRMLHGSFRSEWGDVYPVDGTRTSGGVGLLGTWELSANGATSHPYSDFGVPLALEVTAYEDGYSAVLSNGWADAPSQAKLLLRRTDKVSISEDRLTMVFSPTISWSEQDFAAARQFGVTPQADRPVARVHALYYDTTRAVWSGMADPRGRGSAASAVIVPEHH